VRKKFDYLIVGAGLYGSVFAHEATACGKKCLVIEKRNHIAGNLYTENIEGINVHVYGGHIFHTSNREVWEYMQQFCDFNRYINSPIAYYKGKIYNLPFNMNTFNRIWGVITPDEAKAKIAKQVEESGITEPRNLEEQAISLVGKDIYEILIKGYTEKQWGRKATELPAFIIKRLPLRFTYDNNYFDDIYQGIPIGGYTSVIEEMLAGIEVMLETDYFSDRDYYNNLAKKVLFTGMIDQYFDYTLGELEYRSLRFENQVFDVNNYQGNAAVNYTEFDIPYTRIIEHKHFEFGQQEKTVITREYPKRWERGDEPYYPINNIKNNTLFTGYKNMAEKEKNIIFGGRLAEYRYYDMDDIVEKALETVKKELDEMDE